MGRLVLRRSSWCGCCGVSPSVWDGNASESYQAVQLKGAASILALLWRHRDDEHLQNLLENLWLSRELSALT